MHLTPAPDGWTAVSKRRHPTDNYEVHEYERTDGREHLLVVYSQAGWRAMYTFQGEGFTRAAAKERTLFDKVEREIGKLSAEAAT